MKDNIIHLKSNMDRFIGCVNVLPASHHRHLKSNMDRFIESAVCKLPISIPYLKSNMDRFIAKYIRKDVTGTKI